jgi:hypothetical protein
LTAETVGEGQAYYGTVSIIPVAYIAVVDGGIGIHFVCPQDVVPRQSNNEFVLHEGFSAPGIHPKNGVEVEDVLQPFANV